MASFQVFFYQSFVHFLYLSDVLHHPSTCITKPYVLVILPRPYEAQE